LPEQLNVGVIGAGRMGAFHVRNYGDIDCARVGAIAEPDEVARSRAIGDLAVSEHADWRTLVDSGSDELDAVSICCPSNLHAEITLAALAQGLHVFGEKPIATTLPDALRMRGAAREAGRKLMIGHVERFNPVVEQMRELIAKGALGRVYRAHATRVGPLPPRIRDAGVATDLATHDLDVIQYLLSCRVNQIYSEGGSFEHPTQEDLLTCLARLECADGAETLGLLDVSWLTPERRRELTLIGERGLLRASYIEQQVWHMESESVGHCYQLPKAQPLRRELEAFCRCVLDDLPEPVSAHDGVRALAAALAMRESALVRRPVQLLDIPAPRPLEAVA
jgi:UDP-N-acetylglucosamine 3-dehydrogenase